MDPIWSSKLCLADILSVDHLPKDLDCKVGAQCRSATTVIWWHFELSSQDCWRFGGDGGLRFNVFNPEQSSLKIKKITYYILLNLKFLMIWTLYNMILQIRLSK